MAKTNFTKVEEMLSEGLRKMMVENLLDQADAISKQESDKTSKSIAKQDNLRLKVILALQRDMKFLEKKGQGPYELFGITKKMINKYLKHPDKLTAQEWTEFKETQSKIHKFRKDFEKNTAQNDSDLIEHQKRRHITKRYNINEEWLPLT